MDHTPPHLTASPLVHEIDTWPWRERLGREGGRPVELATVPGRPGNDRWGKEGP